MDRRGIGTVFRLGLAVGVAAALTGCGLFKAPEKPLPGKRISVIAFDEQLSPDAEVRSREIRLPRPYSNPEWPQAGGYPAHAMYHLALPEAPTELWSADMGSSAGSNTPLIAPPIVADGMAFVHDPRGVITAASLQDGSQIWAVELTPEDESSSKGYLGGIAYDNGVVYAAIGFGFVVALDAKTGAEYWRRDVGVPLRSAPTVNGGRVFAITQDNQLYALNAQNGEVLWSHQGIAEPAGLLATSSPAVAGDTVVVAYSSGELVALRVENGRVAWADSLQRTARMAPLAALNDIAGQPVIDRGRVFAVSHSGRMISVDLRTGERVWDRPIASVQTPWIAGDWIYLLTEDAQLVCLSRDEGKVRWVTELGQYEDAEDKEDPIFWSGPVLAGDRLVVVSSNGYAVSVSPYTGDLIGRIDMPTAVKIPPIVAAGTLYVLDDDTNLIAMR